MQCPRCGGDMSSGVCEDCGFPETVFKWDMIYTQNIDIDDE